MNRLKGMTCYLCGPMDRVPDGGVEWREDISKRLKKLGVGVFNPCDKPSDFAPEDDNTRERIAELKSKKRFAKVSEIMKPICSVDLRMVDIAHFVIMNLDLDVHLCGSYHEAFVAISQKKPVIIRCEQGKSSLPNWMFGVVPHQMVFGDWKEVMKYLNSVNKNKKVANHNRWRFFDFEKVYGET
tara:strand:+ start:2177 stop:2728 length:552 start_codon:yes stop_codon:yes gene_type:complete